MGCHDPLSPPRRLMRILCPIVQALMLAMLNVKLHFPARRGVGLEFVGDHDAWRLNGAFQEFRQEALRRSAVSPFLDQNVENKAVLIDRAPEPVSFAGDGNDDLVQMPFTWGWFGQGGIQRRIAKLLWLLRYPGSEPDCATWAFPRQIKLTCGRRIKRLHQYPACGGWGSGGRDHTYRRQFKPMASSIRPPGSAETDQVSVDCVNPLRWPMRRPSRWRLL